MLPGLVLPPAAALAAALPAGPAAVHFAAQCQLAWDNGVPEQVLACVLVTHGVAPAVCARWRLDDVVARTCAALRTVVRR